MNDDPTEIPPRWSLKVGDEQSSLTHYPTPIFMARLCQSPHEC